MIENGLYVIKRELLELIDSLGGDCDMINGDKRPVFCCIKDNKIDGLYWSIPTSDLSHRENNQKEYYEFCLERPDNDLRSCYYHIAKTTKRALYKISSCCFLLLIRIWTLSVVTSVISFLAINEFLICLAYIFSSLS